jgi:hypothetical protein
MSYRKEVISLPIPVGVFASGSPIGECMADAEAALSAILAKLREPPIEMVDAALWQHQKEDDRALYRGQAYAIWTDMLAALGVADMPPEKPNFTPSRFVLEEARRLANGGVLTTLETTHDPE